jgi:hypothetical protein
MQFSLGTLLKLTKGISMKFSSFLGFFWGDKWKSDSCKLILFDELLLRLQFA